MFYSCLISRPCDMEEGTETVELSHSAEVMKYKGKREVENTRKNNAVAIKALARFSCGSASILTEIHDKNKKMEVAIELLQEKLFGNATPFGDVPMQTKKIVKWELIEFVVRYRKADDKQVSPETMMNYLRGIKRVFKLWGFPINIFSDLIFLDDKHGLKPVMENVFAEQQSNGHAPSRKNTLSKADFVKFIGS